MDGGSVTPGQRTTLGAILVLFALLATAIFIAALSSLIWWGTAHTRQVRAEFQRKHEARELGRPSVAQRDANCVAGQYVDSAPGAGGACSPYFPAPLAFVNAIMDARYTACDVSFERLMCGGWLAPDNQRALGYAQLRYRRMARYALEQSGDPFYRACVTARGTASARRETTIEYRHVVETLLADLYVASDLPAMWGRLTRAGYTESAGAPLTLHKRQSVWYLSSPVTLIEWTHALSESRLYQLLQSGPIAYNVVELQQRMQLIMQTAQTLYHQRYRGGGGGGEAESLIAVPFEELPQSWPWSLYLRGVTPPNPGELIVCDDLAFLQWALGAGNTLTIHNWRAWHEFHLAQAHQGHLPTPDMDCLNLTLAVVPELVNAALIRMVDAREWQKTETEALQLATLLLPDHTVRVVPQRVCEVQASMSPDRFDHNMNLVRSWRWAQEQTAPLLAPNTLDLAWWLVRPPLFNLAYGLPSRLGIFGAALLHQALDRDMRLAIERLTPSAWRELPLTGDRQHFFMVFAQAFCATPGIDVDAALRNTSAFREVMGCHQGQAMY
jgi:hypothetical protein